MNNIIIYIHKTSLFSSIMNQMYKNLPSSVKLHVLHIGSLYSREKIQKDYNCIDIGKEKFCDILRIFKEINPSLIISFGFVSINELLILRISKHLSIKTIYIQHGLVSSETTNYYFSKLLGRLQGIIYKNYFYIRNYLQFLNSVKHPLLELKIFYTSMFKRNYHNTKFDKAIFFSMYSFNIINPFFNYDMNNVSIVGYPLFIDNRHKQEIISRPKEKPSDYTVYIHQPFICDGISNISYTEEKKYILRIYSFIKERSISLKLLLHPRESTEKYQDLFNNYDIEIIQQDDKFELINNAKYVIGHYSSLLFLAAYFIKPLIILPYPKVKNNVSVFDAISIKLTNIQGIKNIDVDKEMRQRKYAYKKFIDDFFGGGCLFEDIVKEIVW